MGSSEETVGFDKIVQHEEAAHEKRNWVRLTYDCNDRCIFCLDSDTHDGTARDREAIKTQILDGRRKGAERLILSGGEPTIHPQYVDFIRLGRMAGYPKIQTVTNGRMFKYREFLGRCLDAGLDEITFSIHGPNARIHDALVGVKGAYEEEIVGLQHALADGRPIVMLADRPVTGGYPVPAVVIGADIGRVARLRPGDELRFASVSLEEARSALCRAEEELAALEMLDAPADDELGWAGSHR